MSKNAAKNWCFTINNYGDCDIEIVRAFFASHCGYCVFGLETGDNGTPHLQGYFQLRDKLRLTGLKKCFHPTAHLEIANGTAAQASEYCKKTGEFVELGTLLSAGSRTDLKTVCSMVVAKRPISEIAAECPDVFVKYHRGLEALSFRLQSPRDFKTEVFWYWGPTGTGKSRLAAEQCPGAYYKMPSNKWWDSYEGEDVIIDDYRRDLCTFSELLRLFDRYPMLVESKGGSKQFRSRRIFITTPKDPASTWDGRTEEDISQLMRRIEHVQCFADLTNPVCNLSAQSM